MGSMKMMMMKTMVMMTMTIEKHAKEKLDDEQRHQPEKCKVHL